MKVLMLSGDKKILEEGSAVRARMALYGEYCDELNILIPTVGGEKDKTQIAKNVFALGTASSGKIFSFFDLISLGKKIASSAEWKVTSQDPFFLGLSAWRIAKNRSLKLELQIHTEFLSPYFKKESLLNKIRVSLAKLLLPKADGIRVVSERIARSLKTENLKLKTTPVILPIFVDIEKISGLEPKINLHEKYPQFDFIVLMASRLEREKNIVLGIEAMREVVNKNPRAGLVIVGSGSEEFSLKLKTENLKLGNNVVFKNWTNDVISYMKTADVFLNTSNYEGFGLTLIEAGASGVPVITTDVGLAGEILKDGSSALICPVGDKECIVEKINQLAGSRAGREMLVSRAKREVLSVFSGRNKNIFFSGFFI